jgi:dephospho-CoA kinase
MRRICLTGGIGGGKSTVGAILRRLGAQVVDADALAREIIASPQVRREITRALGRSFYASSGALKAPELAAYIFHHPDALEKVNAIVHPRVYAEIQNRYERLKERPGCFVVETALAIETGYADSFETVVVVTAQRTERLRRLVELKGLSPDQAVARMAAQLPQEEKVTRADRVIDNDGSIEELEEMVGTIYREICTDE